MITTLPFQVRGSDEGFQLILGTCFVRFVTQYFRALEETPLESEDGSLCADFFFSICRLTDSQIQPSY